MAKSSQVNIRFDETTDSDLEAAAKGLGTSKSALVRHLTEVFLREVKKDRGLKIDPTWVRNVGKADARSDWGERKMPAAEEQNPPAATPMSPTKNPKKKGR